MRNAPLVLSIALITFSPIVAAAHPGIGIVVDSKGNVFYTDLTQVWRIGADGTKSVAVPRVHTHELCLDADDNLFGQHLWYEGDASGKWGHRVWRLSAAGKLEDVIPSTTGFLTNYSFVRDAKGNMYWAGDGEGDAGDRITIRKRTPDGTVSTMAGSVSGRTDGIGSAARFTDVRWIAASAEGTIYAVDSGSIRRIAPDGRVTTLAAGLDKSWHLLTGGKCHHLMGLCPDSLGNVYVANLGAGVVDKLGADGTARVFARSSAPYAPTGVTVTRSGDVLILECAGNRARVRKISADGKERAL